MTYNEDSFLAGVAVGRQMKGWCYAPGRHLFQGPFTVPFEGTWMSDNLYVGYIDSSDYFVVKHIDKQPF